MRTRTRIRGVLAGTAVAIAIAAGVAAGASGAPSSAPPGKSVPASGSAGAALAGVHAALDRLVAGGTITAAQAAAVQRQADAGSIDPSVLVDRGVLNAGQMRAVEDAFAEVKQAVASAAGASGAQGTPPRGKSVPASASAGGVLAGVHAALDRLVAGGTITAAQAAAVQRQADAGSIDPKVLVDHGVLTDAQMRAVAAALDQVKRAAAG